MTEPKTKAADPLTISASQLATWDDCRRKWWLQRVARLPEVPRGYLIFGTVLHACLERWASADANGRVPLPTTDYVPTGIRCLEGPLAGQPIGFPVDVFSPGWETVEERGVRQTVTPNEAALIRRLVNQAVERGIVARGDGRVLEREIRLPVIEGVELVGFVDVFKPAADPSEEHAAPEIHDHKTFGEGSVRFLKQPGKDSPNYVGADAQLLTYAAATSIIDGWTGPFVVRHNQFPKFDDSRGPRTVEAVVQPAEWQARWEQIQIAAREMLAVREIKRWDDVPGPKAVDTCSKYGGCPFREICGRRTTLDGYRATVERQIAAGSGTRPNVSTGPLRGEKSMTSDNIFARARGARPATVEQPQTAAAAPAAPHSAAMSGASLINGGQPSPTAPVVPPTNAPPWANPSCTACGGQGFNSKGRPCPICDALAKRSKRPTSSMYLVEGDAQAGFTAKERPEHVAALFAIEAPKEWSSKAGAVAPLTVSMGVAQAHVEKVQQQVVQSMGVAANLQQPPVSTVATAPTIERTCDPAQQGGIEVDAPAAAKEKRGRKPVGLTILIGCSQLKGPDRPTITAQELLQKVGAELAKDMAASSYWELEAFKRRDRIRQRSAEIAEQLGTTVLQVAGLRDPDVDSLIGALIPYAQVVLEGLR